MTIDEAKSRLLNTAWLGTDEDRDKTEEAVKVAITALELLDTLIDRPCSACRYHKENGCCKWNCVFDGHIGKKERR